MPDRWREVRLTRRYSDRSFTLVVHTFQRDGGVTRVFHWVASTVKRIADRVRSVEVDYDAKWSLSVDGVFVGFVPCFLVAVVRRRCLSVAFLACPRGNEQMYMV